MEWGALPLFPAVLLLLLLPPRQVTPEPTSAMISSPPGGPPLEAGSSRDQATAPETEKIKTPASEATAGSPFTFTPGPSSQGSRGLGGPDQGATTSPPGRAFIITEGGRGLSDDGAPSTEGTPGSPEPAVPETTARPGPWPEPVTDVAELCVCDLLVDECDVNCCCDPTCTAADFSLFTTCSVPVVRGDSQFCRQDEALYSIDQEASPPLRIFHVAQKTNPSIFCIHTINHKPALSFEPPEIPTEDNFDRLLQEFGGDDFGVENDLAPTVDQETRLAEDTNETVGYQYKDPIQTSDGFLRLPVPLFFSQCAISNPAGFLVNQAVKCNTMVKEGECTTLPALSMEFYTNSSILSVPNSSQTVNITIQSITLQTPQGLRTRLENTGALRLPTLSGQSCSNIALEARYLVTFTETGEIIDAVVNLVLGILNTAAGFVQQSFEIRFIQQGTHPVPLSGSPGYVVGCPIKAGFRSSGSGITQSLNRLGQLTIMKSTAGQDCFAAEGIRTPVLFGNTVVSGCQLRITEGADCTILAPALLNALKGQNFPDCVASFGNSLPQNGLDWVQIHYNITPTALCEVPVSFALEAKWTKYGSLANPQAKIVSFTVTVTTAALPQVDPGSELTIPIFSSVNFVDVSAPAEPGYKARPTIDAKLPFDFFFPFV